MKKSFLSSLIIALLLSAKFFVAFAQETPENTLETAVTNPSQGGFSCPVQGGSIVTHSAQFDPVNGHCGQIYSNTFSCNCGTQGRRAKAIDVATNGGDVFLPQIEGKDVNWLLKLNYSVAPGDGGGNGYVFETDAGGAKWHIDFVHMAGANVSIGQSYPSGTNLGKVAQGHVHFTIGKNLANSPVPGTATDCDPNWLPSEFACDPNSQPPTTQPGSPPISSSQGTKASNRLCVKVGSPDTEKPAACTAPINASLPGVPAGEAPPVAPGELAQTIRSDYGVDMKGAWDETHLQWIYQKFYELNQTNPNFIKLLSRETIELNSSEEGPNQLATWVRMPQDGYWANQNAFIPVLMHELSHSIYWNKADAGALTSKYDNLYQSSGKPGFTSYVQGYGEPTRKQENYAEMIAYCLTGDGVFNHMKGGAGSADLEMWATYYKTLAEEITGGPCRK